MISSGIFEVLRYFRNMIWLLVAMFGVFDKGKLVSNPTNNFFGVGGGGRDCSGMWEHARSMC